MIGLLQRVTHAEVRVAEETVGRIGRGLAVLIGVERNDGTAQADRLLERLLTYRVFPDAAQRMNLSLRDVAGWRPTPARAHGRGSPQPPPRKRRGSCLTTWWALHNSFTHRCRPDGSQPTCN
jgi:hypothetical protein